MVVGIQAWDGDELIMIKNIAASWSAEAVRPSLGMASGPVAFLVIAHLSKLHMSFSPKSDGGPCIWFD